MYASVLKEILNLEVVYDPNIGYKAENGTWWEIIPESESEYELDNCRESAIQYLKDELIYSDFADLEDYIDWDKFAKENYTLEDFGYDKYEIDGISYYITKQI